MAPSGGCTRSEGETLEFLLTTHFPNLGIKKEVAALRPPSWLDVPTGGWPPTER